MPPENGRNGGAGAVFKRGEVKMSPKAGGYATRFN